MSFYVSTATFFLLHCDEWDRVVALPRHKFVTGATLLQLMLHRKPKHTIYVRYFSILLYLLNVQVAPTEKKTSLKLWWGISLNVLSWQDSEARPGEFVIFMIEKEDFEVNCLYKTRWESYSGIGEGKKIIFVKKNWPNFLHTFSFY